MAFSDNISDNKFIMFILRQPNMIQELILKYDLSHVKNKDDLDYELKEALYFLIFKARQKQSNYRKKDIKLGGNTLSVWQLIVSFIMGPLECPTCESKMNFHWANGCKYQPGRNRINNSKTHTLENTEDQCMGCNNLLGSVRFMITRVNLRKKACLNCPEELKHVDRKYNKLVDVHLGY